MDFYQLFQILLQTFFKHGLIDRIKWFLNYNHWPFNCLGIGTRRIVQKGGLSPSSYSNTSTPSPSPILHSSRLDFRLFIAILNFYLLLLVITLYLLCFILESCIASFLDCPLYSFGCSCLNYCDSKTQGIEHMNKTDT